MKLILILCSLMINFSCFSQDQYSIHDLKNGNFKADSSYIYTLPFENKKKVFLIQAYESKMSHKGERALDFKIKKGTKICAAREGVVIAARKDSDKGGEIRKFIRRQLYFYTT